MTPNRRRKLIRNISILLAAMLMIGMSQFIFFGDNILKRILNRKAGTYPSGTILIHEKNTQGVGPTASESSLPPEAAHPIRIDFKKLGGWKFKEGNTPIPDEFKKLDGQWIEISGYLYSPNQADFMENFIIVKDLWSCCFGKTPAMNHFIDVKLAPGKISENYGEPVTLIGKFSASELRESDGRGGSYLLSLYRMEAHMIKVK